MLGTDDHPGFDNTCLRAPANALHRVVAGMRSGHAILTVSALVVLASGLPADTQALSDVWPRDPLADRVVDQQRQCGVQLVSLQPYLADPLQHLRCRQARDLFRRAGRCRWPFDLVIPPRLGPSR
jgi:hypothetical protein